MRPINPGPSARRLPLEGRGAAAREPELQGLTALGFTPYEAMAYLILLRGHPATAYEISKRGALTKASVYAALETLTQKGAVQPVSEDPVRYAPVEPERLFSRISRKMTSLCRELASGLGQRRRHQNTEYVWMLSGEQAIEDKIGEMIRLARRQVWIKGPHHLLDKYVAPLKEAARRNVKILIILFGDEATAKRFRFGPGSELHLHEGSGDMLAVGRQQLVIATDFSETLLANFGEHPEGAYTRSNAVVFIAETMIRHEVYLAEIINAFGAAIEGRFGKALISLRSKYLPPKLLRRVQKRLSPGGDRRDRRTS